MGIQVVRDPLGRLAAGVLSEDPPHDGGLGLVDPAVAAFDLPTVSDPGHHVVAKGVAAAGFPGLHAAPQAAPGLVGKVFEL